MLNEHLNKLNKSFNHRNRPFASAGKQKIVKVWVLKMKPKFFTNLTKIIPPHASSGPVPVNMAHWLAGNILTTDKLSKDLSSFSVFGHSCLPEF